MTYRNAFAPRPGARPACACTAIVNVPELLCTICTGVSENVRSPSPPSALPPQRGTPISSSESAASEANVRVRRLISGCKLTDSEFGRHAKNDRTPRDSSGGSPQVAESNARWADGRIVSFNMCSRSRSIDHSNDPEGQRAYCSLEELIESHIPKCVCRDESKAPYERANAQQCMRDA